MGGVGGVGQEIRLRYLYRSNGVILEVCQQRSSCAKEAEVHICRYIYTYIDSPNVGFHVISC